MSAFIKHMSWASMVGLCAVTFYSLPVTGTSTKLSTRIDPTQESEEMLKILSRIDNQDRKARLSSISALAAYRSAVAADNAHMDQNVRPVRPDVKTDVVNGSPLSSEAEEYVTIYTTTTIYEHVTLTLAPLPEVTKSVDPELYFKDFTFNIDNPTTLLTRIHPDDPENRIKFHQDLKRGAALSNAENDSTGNFEGDEEIN